MSEEATTVKQKDIDNAMKQLEQTWNETITKLKETKK
jgi:hypothetical protein